MEKKKKHLVPKEAIMQREIDRDNQIMSLKDSNLINDEFPPDNPNN